MLLGVLSGGLDCGGEGVPDFYSSVIDTNTWIKTAVRKLFPEDAAEKPFAGPESLSPGIPEDITTKTQQGPPTEALSDRLDSKLVQKPMATPGINGSFGQDGSCSGYQMMVSREVFAGITYVSSK